MANTDIRNATSYYNTGPKGSSYSSSLSGFEVDLPDTIGRPPLADVDENPYLSAVLGDPQCLSVEALLPKYNIRGQKGAADISQARMYFTEPAVKERLEVLNEIPGITLEESGAYVGFLLSSVTESRREKVQAMPLQGDNYLATFYGESPRSYSFSGIFYNTRNANWRDIFTKLYDFLFRGSACAKNRTLTQVVYDNRIVSGWLTDLNQTLDASNEQMASFGFSMLVRQEVILTDAARLNYNNAYFTGATQSFERVDGIDALPEYSDYLNTARIKPPPRPRRASGVRKPSCRISRAASKARNRSEAARKSINVGTTQPSPIPSKCDISQAVLQSRRAYQQKVARANRIKDTQKRQDALDKLTGSQELKDLRSFYKRESIEGLSPAEDRRLEALRKTEGFKSFDQILNPKLNVNYATVSKNLPPLTAAKTAGTESAEEEGLLELDVEVEDEEGEAAPAPEGNN